MEKTITIDEKHEIKLNNNVGWLLEYKAQFGYDIVPVIMPLISSLMDTLISLAGVVDKKSTVQDVLKRLDRADISEALIELAGLRLTDFINVLWAMAKTADPEIPEPSRWVRQFETFPLDVLVPEAGGLILSGLVSEKNLQSLRAIVRGLRAKGSGLKPFLSQELNEG